MIQHRVTALAMYYLGMRDCGCLLTIEEFAAATAPGLAGEIAAAVARIEAEAAAPLAPASAAYPTAEERADLARALGRDVGRLRRA